MIDVQNKDFKILLSSQFGNYKDLNQIGTECKNYKSKKIRLFLSQFDIYKYNKIVKLKIKK